MNDSQREREEQARHRDDDIRSKDAIETAIDRSKESDRTWESILPLREGHGWSPGSSMIQAVRSRHR